MKAHNYKKYTCIAFIALALGVLGSFWQRPLTAIGSVASGGNAYQSTTTPSVASSTNVCPPAQYSISSSTVGILGSVNVLASGGGSLSIYDATTSDLTLRSASQATSSIRLADFPTSPTNGSYHFDVEFKRGLLITYTTTGTGVSSTTISYRCGGAE